MQLQFLKSSGCVSRNHNSVWQDNYSWQDMVECCYSESGDGMGGSKQLSKEKDRIE